LYKFDGNLLTEFGSSQSGKKWIPASAVRGITEDKNQRILVATLGGGLLAWDRSTESFRTLDDPLISSLLYISYIESSKDGRVWFGDEDNLYVLNSREEDEGYSIERFLPAATIGKVTTLKSDSRGTLYIAFGEALYKIVESSISLVTPHGETGESPSSGRITSLTFSPEGNIYAGTASGDIFVINSINGKLIAQTSIREGPPTSITSILFNRNRVWIGTNNGLSYSDDPQLSSVHTYLQANSGLSSNHILSLAAEDNFIWVGTILGLNTLSFVPFELLNFQNSGVFNDVMAFTEDSNMNLWIGTFAYASVWTIRGCSCRATCLAL
jgi:ligand-binding sensor domain-containing protein